MGQNNEFLQVPITKIAYENYVEDKLETDITIPDYYPSVLKILRCEAKATVLHYAVENERVVLDGICKWTLIYCSGEDQKIHCYETSSNFTETFNMKSSIDKPQLKYKVKTANVICKLHNSQRATLGASLCIALKVQSMQYVDAICKKPCDNMEVLLTQRQVCKRVLHGDKEFPVSCEIPTDASNIVEILKSDVEAILRDIKVIQDKIIVKGECKTKILFLSKNDEISALRGSVPFSQIIDVIDITENARCSVRPIVTDVKAEMGDNEEDTVAIDIMVRCDAVGYIDEEITVISDAYSSDCAVECVTQSLAIEKPIKSEKYERKVSLSMDFPFEINAVYDVAAEADIQKITAGEDVLCIDGTILFKVIVLTGDEIKSTERNFPFNVTVDSRNNGGQVRCEADVRVSNISFKSDGSDKISVDTDMVFDVAIYASEQVSVVTDLKLGDPIKEKCHLIVMYYGKKGERVWDIVKKYGASVSAVKERNQLTEDVLSQDKMILVMK